MKKFIAVTTTTILLTLLYGTIMLAIFSLVMPMSAKLAVLLILTCGGVSVCMTYTYYWYLSRLLKKGLIRIGADGNAMLTLDGKEINLHVPREFIED